MSASAESRRVIDPDTQFELVRAGESPELPNRQRCDIVGYRCADCGREAAFDDQIEHAEGCDQADVALHSPHR